MTVTYTPSAVSSLEMIACLTFQRDKRLLVRGSRTPDRGSYRISMADYPIDLNLVDRGVPGRFCNGQ